MAKIKINRRLKIMLLRWLKDGINEQERKELAFMLRPSDEEAKARMLLFYDRLYENGTCEKLKSLSLCAKNHPAGNYYGKPGK